MHFALYFTQVTCWITRIFCNSLFTICILDLHCIVELGPWWLLRHRLAYSYSSSSLLISQLHPCTIAVSATGQPLEHELCKSNEKSERCTLSQRPQSRFLTILVLYCCCAFLFRLYSLLPPHAADFRFVFVFHGLLWCLLHLLNAKCEHSSVTR